MSRKANFMDRPKEPTKHLTLRDGARQAAEYLTGLPFLKPVIPGRPLKKPGRGASGESSN